jgi:hypothetical protein
MDLCCDCRNGLVTEEWVTDKGDRSLLLSCPSTFYHGMVQDEGLTKDPSLVSMNYPVSDTLLDQGTMD